MRIFIDQNNYINFPDAGQKNWAAPLARAFQAMANYLRRRLANVVHASDDNHFLENNTFLKIPRVQTVSEANQDLNSGDFDLLRRKDIKDVENKIIQNTENVNNSFSVMGAKSSEQFLEDLQEDLLASTALGDAWATVSQFVADGQTRMTIQEAFAVMAKSINALSPLGEIKPFWGMSPMSLARWEEVDNRNEVGAVNIGDTFLKKGHLYEKPAGFYRLVGGNWALCDGNFPLPPHLHGSSNTAVTAWIPDLRETYLEGTRQLQNGVYTADDVRIKEEQEKEYLRLIIDTMEDGDAKEALELKRENVDFSHLLNYPKFVGKNTFKLETNQLPQHKHGMEHKHGGATEIDGEHKHMLRWHKDKGGDDDTGGAIQWTTHYPEGASDTMFKPSDEEKEGYKNGIHTHNFKTGGSLTEGSPVRGIGEDKPEEPRTDTDATGSHADIDKRPQRLQVAYYMRVR